MTVSLLTIQEGKKSIRDFTVIGAILDRGQKSERKQYGADLMKAQFEECKM